MMTDFFLISVICVFVIDYSGFTQSWKGALGRWLGVRVGSVKPFDCSLCATWWVCIIYAICTHLLTLVNLAEIALFAALTKPLGQVITFARYAVETVLYSLNKLLDKIYDLWED